MEFLNKCFEIPPNFREIHTHYLYVLGGMHPAALSNFARCIEWCLFTKMLYKFYPYFTRAF